MSEITEIIATIQAGEHLTRQQMRDVFEQIMTGGVEPDRMGEIAGAADVMNAKVTRVRCNADCIDTCGTGGDGISTFNVSTTAAIIAAAAGATVAKHGNRTNTRVSGSAEAIAELGVNINADVPTLERCLCECGIAFLYAPNLHPAMKYAAPVRKELGIRTIFNLLGPLTNPAEAKRQVLGTFKPELTETLAQVLAARKATFAWVVNGHNGLCDLTITGETRITEVRQGRFNTFTVHPTDVGFNIAPLDTLMVDSPRSSAHAIRAILEGRDQGPRRQHALLNAGAAIVVAGLADDLKTAVIRAAEAVDSGAAVNKLDELVRISHD